MAARKLIRSSSDLSFMNGLMYLIISLSIIIYREMRALSPALTLIAVNVSTRREI